MKEWKKALIAFGPIMLALWFVIGYFDNFETATFCIAVSLAIAAVVVGWVYFVFEMFDK